MLTQHDERTVVLIDALIGRRSGTLWLTAAEWRELVATVDRLITQDGEALTEVGSDSPASGAGAPAVAA